jgi:glycosyltransferase involved in cell wall biosynthesis
VLQPDLVHGLYLTGYGWKAHDFGVRPLVLSALGSDVLDLDAHRADAGSVLDRLSAEYVERRTSRAVASADVVFTDSLALADDLRRRIPDSKVEIVRFGVESRAVAPAARSRWRKRLGLDEDAFVLLSSRLVRPAYNIDTIVRALPAIRERIPGTVLLIKELQRFSDPEYREACLKLAESLGVGGAVRMIGELDRNDLLELYTVADVYLSVPSTDGTAVSVLEAMAAGVPVVATRAPGIDPTILVADESALLVPVRDANALASAVARLGGDQERKCELAERALDVVRRYADFDRELDRAVSLYEQLVSQLQLDL